MRSFWRPVAAASAALALATGLGGCGRTHKASPPVPPAVRELTLALIGQPASLDPLQVSDASGFAVDSLVYDGLVRVAPDLSVRPDLALSWKVSPDGQVYTFHLNPRARFQDGAQLTAADVVFSFSAYRAPRNGSALARQLGVVRSVEALSPSTVRIALTRAYAPFLVQMASLPILPKHLLAAAGSGSRFLGQRDLSALPVGSGPFRIVRSAASSVLLRRNPHYFLGTPKVQELRILFAASATVALNDLRHGRVDYAPVPALDVHAVSTWPNVRMQHAVALQFASIVWNTDVSPLANPALRRALGLAVDRRKIVAAALGGNGAISDGPVPPSSWAYDKSLGTRPFDPSQALAILKGLGWRHVRGVLENAKGQPLRLTILATGGAASRTVALGLVVRDLTALGVRVSVHRAAFAQYLEDFITGNFQAAFVERGLTADPDVTAYFGSPRINSSGQNAGLYRNPVVDEALVAERRTTARSARRTAIRRMEQAMAADPPALFLYFPYDVVALSSRFGHFAIDPVGTFWSPQDWQGERP